MYLIEPWIFSVQDTSHVTLLSWRTSFHFVPGGGLGCFESLQWEAHYYKHVFHQTGGWWTVMSTPYLLQLTIMSSGRIRRFSMPIFGWSPLPRNKPGGSIRKLAMRSLWLSMIQKPYSSRMRSFSSLIFLRGNISECYISFFIYLKMIKSHFGI